jgi:hypothetical protein
MNRSRCWCASALSRAFVTRGRCCARALVSAFTLMLFCATAPAQDPTPGSLHTAPFPGFASGNGKIANLAIGSGEDSARAVALQPDGKIVLAGFCVNGGNRDFCIARPNGGPFGAQNCKLDFDGDGRVLATTDMLIGARVALGMTGNAVIGGITFAPHAARTTWPAIRDYLVSQCGMSVVP